MSATPLTAVTTASESGIGLELLLPASYDIVWSLVVLVIVGLVVTLVALPRLNAMLDQRSAKIEGGIAKAEQAQQEAAAALERYNAQLAEARAEASRIREQAREDGKQILVELKEQANAEAARITAQAHQQIEAERQAAVQSLRAEVGTLALDLASNVIGDNLSDDARASALVDRFLADLEADQAGRGTVR